MNRRHFDSVIGWADFVVSLMAFLIPFKTNALNIPIVVAACLVAFVTLALFLTSGGQSRANREAAMGAALFSVAGAGISAFGAFAGPFLDFGEITISFTSSVCSAIAGWCQFQMVIKD